MMSTETSHGDSLELFLRFPSEVPDQPLVGESILGRHPITHHCIQESLPLPCVKAQNLKDNLRSQDFKIILLKEMQMRPKTLIAIIFKSIFIVLKYFFSFK